MKVNFYGPTNNAKVINKALTNIFEINRGLADSDLQISKFRTTPNPLVLGDSDFGFIDSSDYSSLFTFEDSS